jgi:hypothetical protein
MLRVRLRTLPLSGQGGSSLRAGVFSRGCPSTSLRVKSPTLPPVAARLRRGFCSGRVRVFLRKRAAFARRWKREPLGSRKTGFDKVGFSPGSLPAARISVEVRETAGSELERLTARMGMRGRAFRVWR